MLAKDAGIMTQFFPQNTSVLTNKLIFLSWLLTLAWTESPLVSVNRVEEEEEKGDRRICWHITLDSLEIP